MKLCLRTAQEERQEDSFELFFTFFFPKMSWTVLYYTVGRASHRDCQPGGAPGDMLCSSPASTLESHTSCAPLVSTVPPLCGVAWSRERRSATAALLPPQRPSEPGPRIWALLENCIMACAFAGRPTKVPQLLTHATEQYLKARHTHRGARCLRTTLLHRCR